MLVVLKRPVTPSSFELCPEIGNVNVVLSNVLKSYELWVDFQKQSASRSSAGGVAFRTAKTIRGPG